MATGDRISELPEPIAHDIMRRLRANDVARLGVVSRRWRSLWSTFPVLDLDETSYKSMAASRPFWNYVRSQIKHKSDLDKFRLCVRTFFSDLEDMIGLMTRIALEKGVKELDLLTHKEIPKYLFFVFPESAHSTNLITTINFRGLELNLSYLIEGCPLIENLRLSCCKLGQKDENSEETIRIDNLKTIKLEDCDVPEEIKISAPNLQSLTYKRLDGVDGDVNISSGQSLKALILEGVRVTNCYISQFAFPEVLRLIKCRLIKNLKISNPNLQTLELVYSFFEFDSDLDVLNCESLKTLSLRDSAISDEWLKHHLSVLLELESLDLISCNNLSSVQVFHEQLRSFKLIGCRNLENVEVDALRMISFVFGGQAVPFELMNSSALSESRIIVNSYPYSFHCFTKLRNMLGFFGHVKSLTLVCHSDEDLIFPKELREAFHSPMYDLKHMRIEIKKVTRTYEEFLESLLWLSPRPDTLVLVVGSRKKSIKFHYNIGEAKEENIVCCRGQLIKCWRHYLKMVEVDDFKGSFNDLMQYLKVKPKKRDIIHTLGEDSTWLHRRYIPFSAAEW